MKDEFSLQSLLDKKFKGSTYLALSEIIDEPKLNQKLKIGTVIIASTVYGKLRIGAIIKEINNDGEQNMFPLLLNDLAHQNGISNNYLQWFFDIPEIQDYISKNATGTIFLRIPRNIIYNLKIPIPRYSSQKEVSKEIIIDSKPSVFKELINQFYSDYLYNFRNEKYLTSIILAAAITETILYQLLIEEGVDKKILEDDRTLGLGKLITYLKLLKLDEKLKLNLTHFIELQKKRNNVVHVGLAISKPIIFKSEDLKCFDEIIKFFGI